MVADFKTFLRSKAELQTTGNVERKKHLQKIKILKFLFQNKKASNAAICNQFNLSLPTSMGLINQLLTEGFIEKKGQGKSEGGRKPDLYGLSENSFYTIGVHINRYGIKLAVIDNNHTIIEENSLNTNIAKDSNIVELLYTNVEMLIKSAGIDIRSVMGLGVSMPGLVSSQEGKNYTYYLSEQEPQSLKEKLEHKFDKPVIILNDAKSATLAEYRFGKAKNTQNALVISMDWGTGLGIIMGGKMQNGSSGFSGEFGHIPFIENGILCHCGKRGCLETEASGLALVRKTKEALAAGQKSSLNELDNDTLQNLDPKHIISAAHKGDQLAIKMLAELGTQLGKGIAILVQLFNPERIILEGKIAQAGAFLTTSIEQAMNTYCMMQLKEKTKISRSSLGTNANLYGATSAVIEAIFKDQMTTIKNSIN